VKYLILRESVVVPFFSEEELRLLVRRQNPDARYILLQDPVSMVRHGFGGTLIDLRNKHPELIDLWNEHGPVVAIQYTGEWEFCPQIEAPPAEEWAEQILGGLIMDEASARDLVRRSPDDRVARLLSRFVGGVEDRSEVNRVDTTTHCRSCGILTMNLGDGLCDGCRGRI
jgi:hypothetical protein